MINLDSIQDQLTLLVEFSISIAMLLMIAVYNYVRTLDRETFLQDISLVRAIMRGEHVCLKKDGKVSLCNQNPRECGICNPEEEKDVEM